MSSVHEKILLALDVGSSAEALSLVQALRGRIGMFKIGLQLYTAEGPALVRAIVDSGGRVFLDLKFHDIPNTVRNAAIEAAKVGASMMTIHTAGGREMMQAAASGVTDAFGERKPLIVGVTVLTSLNESRLRETGIASTVDDQVTRMARLARESGLDGVVCSPREIPAIRAAGGAAFQIVTPGIRMPGQSADDQQRTAAPAEAIEAGANYLVVGRPITRANDPSAALDALIQSIPV